MYYVREDPLSSLVVSVNPLKIEHDTPYRVTSRQVSVNRLLLSTEEDNELGIRLSPERETKPNRGDDGGTDNVGYIDSADKQERDPVQPLFSETDNIYAYQDADEDVELFVSPTLPATSRWKQEFRVIRFFQFWVAAVTWIGMRVGTLFFWTLMPALFLDRSEIGYNSDDWATLLVVAGVGSFVPSVASRWTITIDTQWRKMYFGIACWLSGGVLIGTCETIEFVSLLFALFSGIHRYTE